MDNLAKEEFKRDYTIKTLVQQSQFEQWLKTLFFLNKKLSEEYDFVYQDAFYTKLQETLTEGLSYAKNVLHHLENGNNSAKRKWYETLISGLIEITSTLSEQELEYVEYRRHNTCHIFQNSYEYIQENLNIKKERKGKSLQAINSSLMLLIAKHGSDKEVDDHLNSKLQPILFMLYDRLT